MYNPQPKPRPNNPNLHRNNAAEWLMFAAIYPIAWFYHRIHSLMIRAIAPASTRRIGQTMTI